MSELLDNINFKVTPQFEADLSIIVSRLDTNKSEMLRACVVLALPFLVANPDMINTLSRRALDEKGYIKETLRKSNS